MRQARGWGSLAHGEMKVPHHSFRGANKEVEEDEELENASHCEEGAPPHD